MSVPDVHKQFQYNELTEFTNSLNLLRRAGISIDNPAYQVLYKARAQALGKLGLLQPRLTTLVRLLAGLSPGEIRLFRDAERGWLVEAISKPGATPIRRYVSDEIAVTLIKGELTHELEAELMTPVEEYIA